MKHKMLHKLWQKNCIRKFVIQLPTTKKNCKKNPKEDVIKNFAMKRIVTNKKETKFVPQELVTESLCLENFLLINFRQ